MYDTVESILKEIASQKNVIAQQDRDYTVVILHSDIFKNLGETFKALGGDGEYDLRVLGLEVVVSEVGSGIEVR